MLDDNICPIHQCAHALPCLFPTCRWRVYYDCRAAKPEDVRDQHLGSQHTYDELNQRLDYLLSERNADPNEGVPAILVRVMKTKQLSS